jgi:hypothetical protein
MSKTFIEILEELQVTTGTNDKIALIAANADNTELKAYLALVLDKNITFGIAELEDVEEYLTIGVLNRFDNFLLLAAKLQNRELTGNDAKAEIRSFLSHGGSVRENQWYVRCIKKDLSMIGIGQRMFEKAYDEKGFKFRLGLAEEVAELENVEDEAGQLDKKANGVRTIPMLEDGKLFAIYGGRNGILADNFYFIKEDLEKLVATFGPKIRSCVFDGEMHVNDNLSNTMTLYGFKWRKKEDFLGAKGKLKEKAWKDYCEDEERALKFKADAKFAIFDWMPLKNWDDQDYDKDQFARRQDIEKMAVTIKELGLTRLEIIESEFVADKSAAMTAAQKWIARGFEGGIYKPGSGKYEWKRSRNWIKIKEVEDFEVKITGFLIQKPKYNSDGTLKPAMAGKVVCVDKLGREHKIGTGEALSEKVREHMWNDPGYYIDKIGTCSAQRKSEKNGSDKYICPRLDVLRLDRSDLFD